MGKFPNKNGLEVNPSQLKRKKKKKIWPTVWFNIAKPVFYRERKRLIFLLPKIKNQKRNKKEVIRTSSLVFRNRFRSKQPPYQKSIITVVDYRYDNDELKREWRWVNVTLFLSRFTAEKHHVTFFDLFRSLPQDMDVRVDEISDSTLLSKSSPRLRNSIPEYSDGPPK